MAYASFPNKLKTNIITQEKYQIEIPAGSDYYLKFNSEQKKLEKEELQPVSIFLTENEKNAVAKSPIWIQRKLVQQLQNINNSNDYINLILNSDIRYTDEIAFSIAHSPLGNIPPAKVIEDNVKILYQIDRFLNYADIIDYDKGDGNFYSTIRYQVWENNTLKQFEYPRDIYYWYIVHPRINREEPMLIYEKTWREYFFYHNDVGHTLIKEKLDGVNYLWDGNSFSYNTEIQAIGDWVANTIRYEIIGNRSGQPNIIAHEHTGYCGETQKIVVAAHRTALTPINGIMNYAEDHVWCEFYERGWYHLDGAVNNPYMYTDGWGKDMSSIWAWNGDSSIYEVTSKYIHPEDRITVEFNIVDGYDNPIDGAIVTVLVKGLKDITWYKEYFSEIINEIWDKIPEILKGVILKRIYDKLHETIDGVDEVIEASQISIWKYTDTNGICEFELGKDDEYIFLIQKPNIRYPWPLSKYNRVKTLSETKDISYNIRFNDFSNKISVHNELVEINGNYNCNMKLNLSAYQLQRNIITGDIGTYNFPGIIDFFIVDEENFELYQNGKRFNCHYFKETQDAEINFSLNEENYYIIFRNHAQMTNVVVDYEINIESSDDINNIKIATPSTDIFKEPTYTIGTIVNISGTATSDSQEITIDNKTEIITTHNNKWQYQWDTTNIAPGKYLISIANENSYDSIYIKLIDEIPPFIEILNPENMDIFEEDILIINGRASDNYKLNKIELKIDETPPIILDGKEEWAYTLETNNLNTGEHLIQIIAYDHFGLTNYEKITIIINESKEVFNPSINSLFIKPENPTNISSIHIYCNATTESPFSIKKVILYHDNGSGPIKHEMFKYGDFPPQERHIEDDIQNIPNDPIYGIELGNFQTGEIITYWIEVFDTANNTKKSSIFSFDIL